jgi:hypothetical protein
MSSRGTLASRPHPGIGSLGEHQQARQLQHDTLTHYRRVLGEDHSHVEG